MRRDLRFALNFRVAHALIRVISLLQHFEVRRLFICHFFALKLVFRRYIVRINLLCWYYVFKCQQLCLLGALPVGGGIRRDDLDGVVRIALRHEDHLVRLADLRLGLVAALLANPHEQGVLRLDVHVVQHLFALLFLLLLRLLMLLGCLLTLQFL